MLTLRFSPSGLAELRQLIEGIRPSVPKSDYILLTSIVDLVSADRYIREEDYDRMMGLVQSDSGEGGLREPPHRADVGPDDTHTESREEPEAETDAAQLDLLTFRIFLLSGTGIEGTGGGCLGRSRSIGH